MELHAVKLFYDNRQGLVELEDDVLSIVRQVRELYGDRVKVTWEPTTERYVLIENSSDGTERLIFTTEVLDSRVLDRLIASDSQARGYSDAYDKMEREQDEAQAQLDEEKLEGVREAGEMLHWVFNRESRIFVPRTDDA